MSDKKIDELIELAQQGADEDKVVHEIPENERRFFSDIGLEFSEKERASGQSIYWIYRKWCIENDLPIVTRRKFFSYIRILIPRAHYDKGELLFWVRKAPFDLSEEEYMMMRREYRREVHKNFVKRMQREQNKKTRPRKTSGPKETI